MEGGELDLIGENDDGFEEDLGADGAGDGISSRFDIIITALEEAVMGAGGADESSGESSPPLQAELEAWCRARCSGFAVRGDAEECGARRGADGDHSSGGGASQSAGGGVGGSSGGNAAADTAHPVEWMVLFQEYTELIETRLMRALGALEPPAEMDEVEALFSARADELAGDVFDVLFSLGDYGEFVSLMRSYHQQVAWESRGSDGEFGVGEGDLPSFVGLAPTVAPLSPKSSGGGGGIERRGV